MANTVEVVEVQLREFCDRILQVKDCNNCDWRLMCQVLDKPSANMMQVVRHCPKRGLELKYQHQEVSREPGRIVYNIGYFCSCGYDETYESEMTFSEGPIVWTSIKGLQD